MKQAAGSQVASRIKTRAAARREFFAAHRSTGFKIENIATSTARHTNWSHKFFAFDRCRRDRRLMAFNKSADLYLSQ